MHKRTFISSIEDAVYNDIKEINITQMDLCNRILLELDDKILETTEITTHQYNNTLDLVKTLLIYNAHCSEKNGRNF